jgi:glycosyltransferase involved in cell wall biosynthesis
MEVHAAELAEGLVRQGHKVDVSHVRLEEAFSGCSVATEERAGVHLHVLRVARGLWWPQDGSGIAPSREEVWRALWQILKATKPDVVHFHPLSADDIVGFVERTAQDFPIVTTYHAPLLSCTRGDLLRFGGKVCDGTILRGQCAACVLHQKGLPLPIANVIGRLPLASLRAARHLPGVQRVPRASAMFSWPQRVVENREALSRILAVSRSVIAVCNWVRDLLIRNGLPPEKIKVVRYGRRLDPIRAAFEPGPVARFGYLGRLNFAKGIGVLLEAIDRASREARFTVEFVSPAFESALPGTDEEFLAQAVRQVASRDPRVIVGGSVSPRQVGEKLVQWDALFVPSTWMETGPQVVTEAFHAHTPVIASRRGGMEELIIEGRSGFFVPPGDADALAAMFRLFAAEPERLRALRGLIPPARTADEMVSDVLSIYRCCA